jgi:hypothetical protein
LVQELTPLKSLDEKLDHFISKLPVLKNSAQHFKAVGVSFLSRLKVISSFEWDPKKTVKSRITLLRPGTIALKTEEGYGLLKVGVLYCKQGVPYVIVRCTSFLF